MTGPDQKRDILSAREILEDVGQLSGNASVGRNPCYLHPKHNCHYIAVAEWKQQSVETRLVDINDGYELDKTKMHADSTECYASLTILCYEQLIKALTKETRISGVCIILPGSDRSKAPISHLYSSADRLGSRRQIDRAAEIRIFV